MILIFWIVIFSIILYFYFHTNLQHKLYKYVLHEICGIHTPDLEKYLRYDENLNVVYTKCEYCGKDIIYHNVCKYIMKNNPCKLLETIYDDYCYECQLKNYTNGHDCCPKTCNEICNCTSCERMIK